MNRCQHAEKISHFCITETCTWKESGGCQNCMKKYHNHIGRTTHILETQVVELLERIVVPQDTKAKCRQYQQAIYNYFTAIKTHFSTCIDSMSRLMLHRVGSPYLHSKGLVSFYKKLKAKEYRKIQQKQLNPVLSFIKNIDKAELETRERELYHQEACTAYKIIQQFQNTYKNLSGIVFSYGSKIQPHADHFAKIKEINNLRLALSGSPKKQEDKQERLNKDQFTGKIKNLTREQAMDTGKQRNRQRKISIDSTFQPISIKLPTASKSNERQQSILQQKQHLFEMMNQNKKPLKNQPYQIAGSQENTLLPQDAPRRPKLTSDPKPLAEDVTLSTLKEKQKNINTIVQQQPNSPKQNCHEETNNVFDTLLTYGIDFPELVAHTILPEAKSQKKLYEQTQIIKKKTIPIPMKSLTDKDQCSSPLLKKRRTINQNIQQEFSLGMKKISHISNGTNNDEQIKPKEETHQQRLDQIVQEDSIHQIEDHEANSLALLMESLHLKTQLAIPILQAAVRECKSNLSAVQYLTYLYLQIGRSKQCLDLCNEVLANIQHSQEFQQLSIHLLNNKAAALNILGRYSQAIVLLESILAQSQKGVFYKNLGDAYLSIGIYEKALFNYEQAVKLNEFCDEAHFNMAVCLFMQGNYNNCKIAINTALQISPQNPAYKQLADNIEAKIERTDQFN